MNVTVGPGSSVRFMLMSKQMAGLVKNDFCVAPSYVCTFLLRRWARNLNEREGDLSSPLKKKKKLVKE